MSRFQELCPFSNDLFEQSGHNSSSTKTAVILDFLGGKTDIIILG